mgnify:CR=1 FL=1
MTTPTTRPAAPVPPSSAARRGPDAERGSIAARPGRAAGRGGTAVRGPAADERGRAKFVDRKSVV